MTEVPAGNNRMLVVLCVIIACIVSANLISTCIALNANRAPDISFSPSFRSLPASIENALSGLNLFNFSHLMQGPQAGANKTKRSVPSYYSNNALTFSQSEAADRPYTIQYGADFGAYDYAEGGEHKGFFRDLVNTVCGEMGMDCRMVYDRYSNCLLNNVGQHPLGGAGLLGGYYDGCIGWPATSNSKHIMQFSDPITGEIKSYFYIRVGESFDAKNIKGKKIGVLSGSPNIPSCVLSNNNVILADNSDALRDLLLSGQVDAVFANEAVFEHHVSTDKIQKLADQQISCTQGLGLSMMTKKGNDNFMDLWNEGFRRIKQSGVYHKLCHSAEEEHGVEGPIHCF